VNAPHEPAAPRQALLTGPDGTLEPREIHTIFCVGKNYAEHAREMGAEPQRGEPTLFLKPAVSLRSGSFLSLALPSWSSLVHHEVELVALVGPGFDPREPLRSVLGYGVGLDLTLRDVQNRAKSSGAPWTASKGFPGAALLSPLADAAGRDPARFGLALDINGETRQSGTTADMLHDLPSVMRHVHERYGLLGGELLYTGTPAGVGPVLPGDRLRAILTDLRGQEVATLEVTVTEAAK
jgi:2-keto-4-pentenoate hydratase/2-oxohepta-3-ene-1,7-dioic acid hydratase in catechol pathway